MRAFDFWHVDVFTDRPLTGNPLAVFPRAEGLTDEEMQAIAREMNLSETTFVLPPTKPEADYRNRIFTPGGELPFAGHPSIGTAFVAAMEGLVARREGVLTIHQEVGIGVLPLELHIEEDRIRRVVMTQGEPRVGPPIEDVAPLATALGVRPHDITATGLLPRVAWTGIESLQVPIRSLKVVRDIRPTAALGGALRTIHRDAGAYVFALEGEAGGDVHARGFFPGQGIVEDPATGSAAGACGAFLAASGRLPEKEWFVIEQGIEMNHPSRIEVRVETDSGEPTSVQVGGSVTPLMRGTLELK